jgi:predicted TIM-barrel fold metal-dependent hydrolase
MPSARRVDVHFHIIPPFYQDAVRAAGLGPTRHGGYPPYSPELAIELMDRNEIAAAITSVAMPGVLFLPPPDAKALARRLNEYAADLRARWPKRFGGFAIVPMHNVDDSIAEIAYALDVLKLEGVCLFTSYGEKYLGDASFDPLLEELNRRKVVVYTHPTLHPSTRAISLSYPAFLMEYLFDTTRMATNLIFSGALDRFPDIKFILSHAGGTLAYISWRLGSGPAIDPGLPQWPRAKIEKALRSFWYDNAISSAPGTMMALKAVAGPDKVLFGTDWPFVTDHLLAEHVTAHNVPSVHTDAEREAIDRGNALKLWPHLA